MRITKENIDTIHLIFSHMQVVSNYPTQAYDALQEYRQFIVIAKGLKADMSASEVYCHVTRLTPWQKKIFDKRKKEIPHTSFIEYYEKSGVYRVGFRCE